MSWTWRPSTYERFKEHYDLIKKHNYRVIKDEFNLKRKVKYCQQLPVCSDFRMFFKLPYGVAMTRTTILTMVYKYIKEHDLVSRQNPDMVTLDAPLKKLFMVDESDVWRYSMDVYVDTVFKRHKNTSEYLLMKRQNIFRTSALKEEMMQKIFHPKNLNKFDGWGFGLDDE